MKKIYAFDVYGTLINPHGLTELLSEWLGASAVSFSQTWREKQLEYSFRRGLMASYVPFSLCTKQALAYALKFHQLQLSDAQQQELLGNYLKLPAFDDVDIALKKLKAEGNLLYAFSNGETAALESLLTHAGLLDYFDGIVSCESIQTFKPDPAVYEFLKTQINGKAKDLYLVSSNSFDVIGALNANIQSIWVKRSNQAIFDQWEFTPTRIIAGLHQLA